MICLFPKVQINQNHLQFIRMQMQGQNTNQPIIIHAAPVQSNASPVQQTATQVSAENVWNGVSSHESSEQFPQVSFLTTLPVRHLKEECLLFLFILFFIRVWQVLQLLSLK